MLFSNFLFLATSAAGAAAWTIPEGQPEGVYSVLTDNSGVSEHKFIQPNTIDANIATNDAATTTTTTNLSTRSAKSHSKRYIISGPYQIHCGTILDPLDTRYANGNLTAKCGSGGHLLGPAQDVYSIVGNTVAYYCNFYSDTNICYSCEAADVYSRISTTCGNNLAGWAPSTARQGQFGVEGLASNFCGRGVNAGSN